MAKFTQTQAENCEIVTDENFDLGGTHKHFIFIVKDNNGNLYKVIDSNLSATASKADKKAAIVVDLMTKEKTAKLPVVTIEKDKHALEGTKIKDA